MFTARTSNRRAATLRARGLPRVLGPRAGFRVSRSILASLIGATLLFITAGSSPSGANELPFTNLEEAQRQLQDAQAAQVAVEDTLVEANADLAASSSTLTFLSASEGDRVATLKSWRLRSRQLAVESYINGGPAAVTMHLLDTTGASNLTYRAVLLREQARATTDASDIYATLLDGTDDDLVILIEDIDGLYRRIEGLEIDLTRTAQRIEEAQWVVQIAEIHAKADAEFTHNGRRQPTDRDWAELRHCESTNTYEVNTGNGFYGAYQFDYTTWFTVGGEPGTRADMAPPEEQDARARLLYSRRGSQPWPVCGWKLNS